MKCCFWRENDSLSSRKSASSCTKIILMSCRENLWSGLDLCQGWIFSKASQCSGHCYQVQGTGALWVGCHGYHWESLEKSLNSSYPANWNMKGLREIDDLFINYKNPKSLLWLPFVFVSLFLTSSLPLSSYLTFLSISDYNLERNYVFLLFHVFF